MLERCEQAPLVAMATTLAVLWIAAAERSDGLSSVDVAVLLPLSAGGHVRDVANEQVLPAIELATAVANKQWTTAGSRRRIRLEKRDSKCDMATGIQQLFDALQSSKAAVLGDVCTDVTDPVSQATQWWRLTQLSFADTNPLLADRNAYRNLALTAPNHRQINHARMAVINHFGWTSVGQLYQDSSGAPLRYALQHNHMDDLLDANNLTVHVASFSLLPRGSLEQLRAKSARIIVADLPPIESTAAVLCDAHQVGMMAPKYVWLLAGDHLRALSSWKSELYSNANCTAAELDRALQTVLVFDVQYCKAPADPLLPGLTSAMLNSKFFGYSFDGVIALATALHGNYSADLQWRPDYLQATIDDMDITGPLGPITYRNGQRQGCVGVWQFGDKGELRKVGQFNSATSELELAGAELWWLNNKLPDDRPQKVLLAASRVLFVFECLLAGVGSGCALFVLAVNVRFRHQAFIKMSSPNLNNIVVAGCLLSYISVVLLGLDGQYIAPEGIGLLCALRMWILAVGFTLAFGALFAKTWRVYAIFQTAKVKRKVITDNRLFVLIGVLLLADCCLLGLWQIIDPLQRHTETLTDSDDPDTLYELEFCESNSTTLWMGVMYTYKGILLIVGCFLAWETRHINVEALNDSKYIGMSVYNVVIMCTAGAIMSILITKQPNASYALIASFINFCTTLTLALVFVPKLMQLKKDPEGTSVRKQSAMKWVVRRKQSSRGIDMRKLPSPSRIMTPHDVDHIAGDVVHLRMELQKKDDLINELQRLVDDSICDKSPFTTPDHYTLCSARSQVDGDSSVEQNHCVRPAWCRPVQSPTDTALTFESVVMSFNGSLLNTVIPDIDDSDSNLSSY